MTARPAALAPMRTISGAARARVPAHPARVAKPRRAPPAFRTSAAAVKAAHQARAVAERVAPAALGAVPRVVATAAALVATVVLTARAVAQVATVVVTARAVAQVATVPVERAATRPAMAAMAVGAAALVRAVVVVRAAVVVPLAERAAAARAAALAERAAADRRGLAPVSGGSGGKNGSAGASSGGGGSTSDACSMTTQPTGGTTVQSSNKTGKAAGLDWAIWSNGSGGSITTYSVPAFSAAWNNSGDFLARLGLQWNASKTYDQYGTITAQFNYKKSGSAGGYSYIGMYGWSVSPCVEWYIVDDSYNGMPFNPGNTTNKGTATIDGGKYTLYTRQTNGTGGSKCPNTTSWVQFYSMRQTARQCGQISVTEHFNAWAAAGMTLGKMDQAQILIEVGGGTGTIDFTVANVTSTM